MSKRLWLLFLLTFTLGANVVAQEKTDAKEAVLKAFKTFGEQKSWVVETTVFDKSDEVSSKILSKFLSPDRYHSIWTAKGEVLSEVVMIGVQEYSYTIFDKKWEKTKKDKLDIFSGGIARCIGYTDDKYLRNFASGGNETIGGIGTNVYQYEFDVDALMEDLKQRFPSKSGNSPPTGGDEIKLKMWINDDGLPVKFESVRKTESPNPKLNQTTKKVTTFKYEEVVAIVAPKK